MDKTATKMDQIAKELKEKTDISLYVAAREGLGGQDIREYEKQLRQQYEEPFVAILFALEEKKIDIIHSSGMEQQFDKKKAYWDSIIPLMPVKEKDKTVQRYSAALLNGHADIVQQLSAYNNVKLDSAIAGDHTEINTYVQYVFGFMIVSLLGVYLYSRFRS